MYGISLWFISCENILIRKKKFVLPDVTGKSILVKTFTAADEYRVDPSVPYYFLK
jgi:hypothetical protein